MKENGHKLALNRSRLEIGYILTKQQSTEVLKWSSNYSSRIKKYSEDGAELVHLLNYWLVFWSWW